MATAVGSPLKALATPSRDGPAAEPGSSNGGSRVDAVLRDVGGVVETRAFGGEPRDGGGIAPARRRAPGRALQRRPGPATMVTTGAPERSSWRSRGCASQAAWITER